MAQLGEDSATLGSYGEGVSLRSRHCRRLEVQVGLTPHLGPGVEAYIAYALRSESYLRDNAQYDDRMIVEFDPTEVDLAEVAKTVFPQYVEAFGAYRATIVISDELSLDDWDEICELCRTGKDVNGRDGVHRINSVNYFDRELCRRAFESSPEDILDRLDGKVETARIVADGVLLIVTSDMVDRIGADRRGDTGEIMRGIIESRWGRSQTPILSRRSQKPPPSADA